MASGAILKTEDKYLPLIDGCAAAMDVVGFLRVDSDWLIVAAVVFVVVRLPVAVLNVVVTGATVVLLIVSIQMVQD